MTTQNPRTSGPPTTLDFPPPGPPPSPDFPPPDPSTTLGLLVLAHRLRFGWDVSDRRGDRGSGVVEWLGVSALSIALLVGVFSMLEQVGLDMVGWIRLQLGVG